MKKKTGSVITSPKHKTFKSEWVEYDGLRFQFDGKIDPKTSTMKVYRIYGDVTNMKRIADGLQLFADSYGLRMALQKK